MRRSVSWAADIAGYHAPPAQSAPVPRMWSPACGWDAFLSSSSRPSQAQHEAHVDISSTAVRSCSSVRSADGATGEVVLQWSDRSDETTSSDPDPCTASSDQTSCKPWLLLHVEADVETAWGDAVVLVGNTRQLGGWSVERGLPLTTDAQTYPRWNLSACLELDNALDDRRAKSRGDRLGGSAETLAGVNIEFKLVVVHAPDADGTREPARWEVFGGVNANSNRQLQLAREGEGWEAHQASEAHLLLRWGELPMRVQWCAQPSEGPPSPSPQNLSPALPRVPLTPLTAEALKGHMTEAARASNVRLSRPFSSASLSNSGTAVQRGCSTQGGALSDATEDACRQLQQLQLPRGASVLFTPLSSRAASQSSQLNAPARPPSCVGPAAVQPAVPASVWLRDGTWTTHSVPGSTAKASSSVIPGLSPGGFASQAQVPVPATATLPSPPPLRVNGPTQPSRQVSELELPPAATVGVDVHGHTNNGSAEAMPFAQPVLRDEWRLQLLQTLKARAPLPPPSTDQSLCARGSPEPLPSATGPLPL